MKYYKVLKNDGSCVNGGSGKWYLPKKQKDGTWKPGKWMPKIDGRLEPCENGYHICRPSDLIHWLDEAIFEVEYDGEIVEDDEKCVVRKARLLRRVETWNEKSARMFAADCAERVLHIYEKKHPDDGRPRKAIQAARDYANGKITKNELAAARDAARDAAWYAARAAAWDAPWDAPLDAAWDAAWGAARAAARAAAWAAVRDAERKWQTERLFEYLEAK